MIDSVISDAFYKKLSIIAFITTATLQERDLNYTDKHL